MKIVRLEIIIWETYSPKIPRLSIFVSGTFQMKPRVTDSRDCWSPRGLLFNQWADQNRSCESQRTFVCSSHLPSVDGGDKLYHLFRYKYKIANRRNYYLSPIKGSRCYLRCRRGECINKVHAFFSLSRVLADNASKTSNISYFFNDWLE